MMEIQSSWGQDPIISVIIVHRGDSDAVYSCVEAITRAPGLAPPVEVVLVENGGHELVRPRVGPGVLRVRMRDGDRGYAAAANEGAACARARYLMLLDPRAPVSREDLTALSEAAELDGRLAGVTPALVHRRDPRRVRRRRRWARWLHMLFAGAGTNARLVSLVPQPVHWAPAVALLVRADVFRALGGLDEAFGDVGADEDWCRRAVRRGYRVAMVPGVRVPAPRRAAGRSGRRRDLAVRARLRIVERHSGWVAALPYQCFATVYLGARMLLEHVPGRALLSDARAHIRLVPRVLRARSTKVTSTGS